MIISRNDNLLFELQLKIILNYYKIYYMQMRYFPFGFWKTKNTRNIVLYYLSKTRNELGMR